MFAKLFRFNNHLAARAFLVILSSMLGVTILHAGEGGHLSADRSVISEPADRADRPVCLPNCDDFLNEIRRDGSTRVIVTIRIPDLPPLALTRNQQGAPLNETRKRLIAEAQQRILRTLPPRPENSVATFALTPAISVSVDETGLRALLGNGDVTKIVKDEPMKLSPMKNPN